MRLVWFTDTLGDVNGVSRFIQNMAEVANEVGRDVQVVTSTRFEVPGWANIHNFKPLFSTKMPKYPQLELAVPNAPALAGYLKRLGGAGADVVHISTPGPVGIVGFYAARRMGLPILGTYHTDFPSYIDHLFDDHACTWMCTTFMRRVYGAMRTVFSRSPDFVPALHRLGIPDEKIEVIPHGIKTDEFDAGFRDPGVWGRLEREEGFAGIDRPAVRAIFVSRVSVEKNAPLLTRIWKRVSAACAERGLGAQLVIVGDGPYKARMEEELVGTETHFLGFRTGRPLATLYASADLFIFPSVTETLGQVVMEAQCAGLPAIVADEGGPAATVADAETGFVLPASEPERWVEAAVRLIEDGSTRERMGRAASERMAHRDIRDSFEFFWEAHERAVGTGEDAPRPVLLGAGS